MSSIEQLYESLENNEQALAKLNFEDLQQVQVANVKFFIIACASFFEDKIKLHIENFTKDISNENAFIIKFVKKELIGRGYYKIIDWSNKKTKIDSFLKYFGVETDNCKELFSNVEVELSFYAYFQIGEQRNNLIHNNIVSQEITLTLRDAKKSFDQANKFVDLIPSILRTTVKK